MTSRSKLSPLTGGSLYGGGNNAMDAALAAFQQLSTSVDSTANGAFPDIAGKVNAYQQQQSEGSAELDELLALAATIADPEVKAMLYQAHDAARMSLAQGLPATEALAAVRDMRNTMPAMDNLRRINDMADHDSGRLAEYIEEQRRHLIRLNNEADALVDALEPYLSEETLANRDAARAELDAANAAMEAAHTDAERQAATQQFIQAQANAIRVDQDVAIEAQQNIDEAQRLDPQNPDLPAARGASRGLTAMNDHRADALAELENRLETDRTLQGYSSEQSAEGANVDMTRFLGREGGQELVAGANLDAVATSDNLLSAAAVLDVHGELDRGTLSLTPVAMASAADVSINDVAAPVITEASVDAETLAVGRTAQIYF